MAETEMVERVAKVLEPLAWAALGTGDTLAYKNRRTSSLRKARKAIEAMREPTSSMCDAGVIGTKADVSFFDVAETYSAMIDVALSPPSKEQE